MNWLAGLQLLLKLAAYFARRADKLEIERNLINELKLLQGERVEAAAVARDDVLSGRVPEPEHDPYKRD
jgi:hypothetical protein